MAHILKGITSLMHAIDEIGIEDLPLIKIAMCILLVCNLKCSFCSASAVTSTMPRDIMSSRWKSLILNKKIAEEALKDAAELGALILEITGGEPFLHKDLIKIFKYADDLGYAICVATNGTIMDEETAKRLSRIDSINNIQISLDGSTKKTQDSIRGIGTFKKVMKTIKLLKKYEVPFSINTVFSKINFPEQDKLFKLAVDKSALGYRVSFIAKLGRGVSAINNLGLSFSEIIEVARKTYNFYKANKSKIKVGLALPPPFIPEDMRVDTFNFITTSSCNILSYMGVNFDGSVGPCTYFLKPNKEYVVGTLKKQSLIEIWNSKKMLEFRKIVETELKVLKDHIPCRICKFKNSCLGDCPAISYQEVDKIIRPNLYCVKAYESGLTEIFRGRKII